MSKKQMVSFREEEMGPYSPVLRPEGHVISPIVKDSSRPAGVSVSFADDSFDAVLSPASTGWKQQPSSLRGSSVSVGEYQGAESPPSVPSGSVGRPIIRPDGNLTLDSSAIERVPSDASSRGSRSSRGSKGRRGEKLGDFETSGLASQGVGIFKTLRQEEEEEAKAEQGGGHSGALEGKHAALSFHGKDSGIHGQRNDGEEMPVAGNRDTWRGMSGHGLNKGQMTTSRRRKPPKEEKWITNLRGGKLASNIIGKISAGPKANLRKDIHDDMASAGAYSGGAAVYLLEASRRRGAGGDGEAMRGSSLSMKSTGRADEETEEEAGTDRMVQYAMRVNHLADIPTAFPGESHKEMRRLANLQVQRLGLIQQIQETKKFELSLDPDEKRKQSASSWHASTRHDTHSTPPRHVIEGHTESSDIKVECKTVDAVHIRHCNGLGGIIPITVTGLARSLLVEDCNNLRILVDACAFSSAVTNCTGIELVIGGECPSFLLRQVHALQLTVAPNAMDGDIETVGCSGIVMHCVPSVGFVAQSPDELLETKGKYHVSIPSRVITKIEQMTVVSKVEGDAYSPNEAESYWANYKEDLRRAGRKSKAERKAKDRMDKDMARLQAAASTAASAQLSHRSSVSNRGSHDGSSRKFDRTSQDGSSTRF